MKENVTIFTKSAISFFSIWRVFGSFSNKITRKVVTENLKLLLLSCREYLALGMFFSFWFFHLILNFLNYKEKRAKILIFFEKNTFFALFCQKFEKI